MSRRKSDKEIFQDYCSAKPDSNGCILWSGYCQKGGYGQLERNRKSLLAHRFVWMFLRGRIPYGMCVLHSCDNRRCVNIDHLRLGTQKENTADMDERERRAIFLGEQNGRSKLTEYQVRKIRKIYAGGGISHQSLAIRFLVSKRTIGFIIEFKTWKHIK